MTELSSIGLNIVLPIFLAALFGFSAARVGWVTDSRALSRATLYIFSPALLFTSLYTTHLADSEFLVLLFFTVSIFGFMGAVGYGLSQVLRLDSLSQSALLLSVMFVNAGNYGLALNQFAFGDEGLARAAIFFVGNTILSQTFGVYIASRGHSSPRESFLQVFKMPLVYAAAAGLILNRLHVDLPLPLTRAVDLISGASVPVMLTLLGVELAGVTWGNDRGPVLVATLVKLIAAPLAAIALAQVLPLTPLTRNVAILQASMPTAVTASLLAVEFASKPRQVAGAIFLTTLGSLVTLPLLLYMLK